ncbi:PepSY domain-containing protein [Streptomyces griseoviridis]|uniref:PepSY domain-containing protein n=1 Tax=Streptomyces griseoviridis TaxID=45398 RepID=A0A918LBC9_STRGD|nr:PepSY domain-containing protein [Streptomyces niveoruber]GGS27818.1 hypothetical protein GCM10010238_15780 [Streptomyces niveoruber]
MKRNIVIAVVAAAALVGGGTATALAVGGDDGTGGSGDRRENVRQAASGVTAAEAIAAALKDTSGTAVSAELDDEDEGGKAAWEVDVLAGDGTWHSVRVDPDGGGVLGSRADDDEDGTAEVRAALENASVTAAEAAGAAAGKGTVTSVDLDDDGTDRGWEVETRASGGGDERDWRVGLTSGTVTADRDDDGTDGSEGSDGSGDSDDD